MTSFAIVDRYFGLLSQHDGRPNAHTEQIKFYDKRSDKMKRRLDGRAAPWLVKTHLLARGLTSLPALSRLTRRPWKAGRRNTSASCQRKHVIVHQNDVSHHLIWEVRATSDAAFHPTKQIPQHVADLHSR